MILSSSEVSDMKIRILQLFIVYIYVYVEILLCCIFDHIMPLNQEFLSRVGLIAFKIH